MKNHKVCSYENKDFGPWEKIAKPFPYGWFFAYYQLKTKNGIYLDRKNKLDGLFDWMCALL